MFRPSTILGLFLFALLPFQVDAQPDGGNYPTDGDQHDDRSRITVFLEESIDATIVEIVPDAIPVWRNHKAQKPTLILLSQNPFLFSPPETLKEAVNKLVMHGEQKDFLQLARLSHAQPLLPLQQTLRACLNNHFFREIIWVPGPAIGKDAAIDYRKVKELLLSTSAITPAEEKSFRISDKQLHGEIEGVPVTVTALDNLPDIEGGTILHFDLSFFLNGYRNAVKTPLHGILQDSLQLLQAEGFDCYTATISLSTGPHLTSLDFRFLGDDLKQLIAEPKRLSRPLSESGQRRQNILYLENFFQPEETRRLVDELMAETPEDPWVHYWDYKLTAKEKNIEEAIKELDVAITLDNGYADEYLSLAERARDANVLPQGARFLEKYLETFPHNAIAELELTELELALERHDESLMRIERLKSLNWSPLYHTTVPAILEDFERFALEQQAGTPDK